MAIAQFSFYSRALNRTAFVNCLLPQDHPAYTDGPKENHRPLKTLILLHGLTGDQNNWLTQTNVNRLTRGLPLCVLMPDGENSFYCDSAANASRFGTFIGRELLQFFRSVLPLSPAREDTWIAGLSMGGFGAVNCALTYPDTFSRAALYSAALIRKDVLRSGSEPDTHSFTRKQYEALFGLDRAEDFEGCPSDYEALARNLAASGKPLPQLYMDCGIQDSFLYQENQQYYLLLRSLGYDVTWEGRPGEHAWDFWEESLKRTLQWLPLAPMLPADQK